MHVAKKSNKTGHQVKRTPVVDVADTLEDLVVEPELTEVVKHAHQHYGLRLQGTDDGVALLLLILLFL